METVQAVLEWKPMADEIWGILRETVRQQGETSRQFSKQFGDLGRQMKETDRQMKETAKEMTRRQEETARQMKETDRQLSKQFGDLGRRFGEVVEYMVIPNLVSRFEELGFTFTKANRTVIKDREHDIFTEVDAFLENGDKVMAVEIKSKPDIGDINDHIERMEKLKRYAGLHNDKRTYLGALAGVVFGENEKTYAFKKGFYVIEPSGETFKITVPGGKYKPREW